MTKEDLTNVDIVLYALDLLGGGVKKIPTETIAIKCFELAPTRFSWRLYSQYPDADAVRVALFDAKKSEHGGLVVGRFGKASSKTTADGWLFTPNGISWVESNRRRIAQLLGQPTAASPRTGDGRRIHQLEHSSAYRRFMREGGCENIKLYEFTDFLDANLDTPSLVLLERIDRVRALAAKSKRSGLLRFVNECEKYFAHPLKLKRP